MPHTLDRRAFMKTLTANLGALSMPRLIAGRDGTAGNPNIVFMMADDMGYGDPGCYNAASKVRTPNMDRLAAEGIRFTDAHSPSAVCTPTRYGVLTGRYCWRTRLKSHVFHPYDCPLIEPGRLTVGSLLKRYGYFTACIGKWHLGAGWTLRNGTVGVLHQSGGTYVPAWPDRQIKDPEVDLTKPIQGGPVDAGFDYYFGMTGSANYPPYCFYENDRPLGLPSIQKPKSMFGTAGRMIEGWRHEDVLPALTRKAVEIIEQHADQRRERPLFLYFPLTAPHTPIAPAGFIEGKSEAGRYGDFVAEVDWTVGEVMKALERKGLAGNTLVIVTSDNGSPGRTASRAATYTVVKEYKHDPSGGLRGIKADIWEGGHRVPFIARWPGRIEPGKVSDELICLTDLFATCAAIVKEPLPDDAAEDSFDILPALLGRDEGRPVREAVVLHSHDGMFAIRQGPWKLILGRGSGGFTEPRRIQPGPDVPTGQLYHMEDDPSESHDLYAKHPEVVQRLANLLEKYRKEGRSRPKK